DDANSSDDFEGPRPGAAQYGGWPFRTTTGRTTAPLPPEGMGLASFALLTPRRPAAPAASRPTPRAFFLISRWPLAPVTHFFAPGVFNEKNAVQRDACRRAARRDRRRPEADRHRYRVRRTRIP